jgi:glycosyltransferase involved in cell wall biosynthesis
MTGPDTGTATSVAVVIPVFNEGAAAATGAREVLRALAALDCRTALLVVDDGSADDTLASLRTVEASPATVFEVIVHEQNRGYGAALRTGAVRAAALHFDWVLFMDSDLTNPPEHIARFVQQMNRDVDVLKATRYGPGASVEGVPALRRGASRAGNLFARVVSGSPHRDTTNGFRAIRTDAFLALPLEEHDFAIIMEEWYWAQRHGLRGADVPTTLRTRTSEQRSSSFGYSLPLVLRYARYPIYAATWRLLHRRGAKR